MLPDPRVENKTNYDFILDPVILFFDRQRIKTNQTNKKQAKNTGSCEIQSNCVILQCCFRDRVALFEDICGGYTGGMKAECCGLDVKCPSQSHMFDHLVPSWWHCFGR